MKGRTAFLLSLAASLGTLAGAVNVTGTLEGKAAPGTRLGAWAVSPFGQPLQMLTDTPLNTGSFSLPLPAAAPAERLQFALNGRTAWPGLVDFAGASAPAQVTEIKFFTYQDANGSGGREENEALREVQLGSGKGELFVVWSSMPVAVRGGGGYQADLQAGWNVLNVEVRRAVKVTPYAGTPLQLDLGR